MSSNTFTPQTNEPNLLFSRVMQHVESVFAKARRYKYTVNKAHVYLKSQEFRYYSAEVKLSAPASYPLLIRDAVRRAFDQAYKKGIMYRATGCTISDLRDNTVTQGSLFAESSMNEDRVKKIYSLLDEKKVDFGTLLWEQKRTEKKEKVLSTLPVYDPSIISSI